MEFVDLQTYLNGQKEEEDAGGSVPGGGEEQDRWDDAHLWL